MFLDPKTFLPIMTSVSLTRVSTKSKVAIKSKYDAPLLS